MGLFDESAKSAGCRGCHDCCLSVGLLAGRGGWVHSQPGVFCPPIGCLP